MMHQHIHNNSNYNIIILGRGKETSGFFVAALGENVVGTIAYDRKVIITIIIIITLPRPAFGPAGPRWIIGIGSG